MAQYESEHKSERIRRKVEELAEAGKIANGGPRPLGYRRVFEGTGPRRRIAADELEPAEAEEIRKAAKRLLAGDSLRYIVVDFQHSWRQDEYREVLDDAGVEDCPSRRPDRWSS